MTKPWDEHREVIIAQYKEYNKPLHEVQRIMEEQHKFKASTRAYRSRFDKWGVHKYSCRKRKGSGTGRAQSEEGDDDASPSPDAEILERRDSQYSQPTESDSSPTSSIPSNDDHHYYGPSIYETTPPSEVGSPTNTSLKFENQSTYHSNYHHHHQHHQGALTSPSLRHTIPLPATTRGYLADPQQFSYHQFSHHHHQQLPGPFDAQPVGGGYYRTGGSQDHHHMYHQIHGSEPIDLDVHHHHPHHQHHHSYTGYHHVTPEDGIKSSRE